MREAGRRDRVVRDYSSLTPVSRCILISDYDGLGNFEEEVCERNASMGAGVRMTREMKSRKMKPDE